VKGENMKRKLVTTLIILLYAASIAACNAAPKVEWEISISGAVGEPFTITYQELLELDHVNLEDVFMDKSVGEDEYGSWSGVSVDYLLSKAAVDSDYVTVTAVADDGYAIEISKEELMGSIVAFKENGEWIQKSDPEHGPIRLVCPKIPANRWVFKLLELQVNK
jgi:DMSO/TMAO reductase YedYZ molybdopterin-dependent catalytic subunit